MKYYTLKAVVNGQSLSINKKFSTRDAAINAIFRILDRECPNPYVEEIVERSSKHDLEYICNHNNRFLISRIITA